MKLLSKTDKPEYATIHNSIIKKIGYEMTKLRTLELIMYLKGGKDKKNNMYR